MSNSLDPDQARKNVGPDLGPSCLQRLLAEDTSRQIYYNTYAPFQLTLLLMPSANSGSREHILIINLRTRPRQNLKKYIKVFIFKTGPRLLNFFMLIAYVHEICILHYYQTTNKWGSFLAQSSVLFISYKTPTIVGTLKLMAITYSCLCELGMIFFYYLWDRPPPANQNLSSLYLVIASMQFWLKTIKHFMRFLE